MQIMTLSFQRWINIIHHGGTGILYNGIKFNKPSVIIPHDYDQFDYAVRAEIAEIGFPASLKSRKSVIDAVGKMLNKKGMEKAGENVGRL